MKKSEMPETIPYKFEYTAHHIAILLNVADRTACKLIDTGEIPGRRNPVGRRERLVLHTTIANMAKDARYAGIMSKITNLPPG